MSVEPSDLFFKWIAILLHQPFGIVRASRCYAYNTRISKKLKQLKLSFTMRFPPWDPPEPTDEQLLAIVHSDTGQLYESGELTRAQRQQLREGMIAEMFTGTLARGTKHKQIGGVAPEYSYLDELVDQMLSSEPSERPQNIEAVKRQIRARQQDFFAAQRLSESKQRVVAVTDLDDPLIVDPPTLIDWDWVPEELTLILSRSVDGRWIHALRTMGDYSSVWGKGPETFEFRDDRAVIPARENEVEQIIQHFKDWLPKANKRYEDLVRQEIAEQQTKEQRKLEAEIEANEARTRLTKKIKI